MMGSEEEEEGEPPVYAVRLSEPAAAQAEAAFERLIETVSLDAAEDWQEGLRAAWASLATLPQRCAVAPENPLFQAKHPGLPLRVLLYRRGRSAWRLLFTAHAATDDEPPLVRVHQIRHGAQKPLREWPAEGKE